MKAKTIAASSAKEREESIANGKWMPRGHSIPTSKQLANNRDNLKRELKRLCEEVM